MFTRRTNLIGVLVLCLIFSFNSWASRIQYGELGQATTLDPITNTNMVSRRLCELIYSGLLDFDEDHKPIWRLAIGKPDERHQVEYTFTLREAYWHDGNKVKPEDVVFTVEAMKEAASRKAMVDFIHEIQNDGDVKVKFVLRQSILNVEGRTAFKIIPKHIVKEVPITIDNPIVTHPIGSGPYKFVKKASNGVIYLEKNEQYFDADSPPQIDEIEMHPCTTENELYKRLLYGALNVVVSLHTRYAHTIDQGFQPTDSEQPVEPLATEPYNSLSYQFFALNMSPKHDTVGSQFLRGNGDKDTGAKVRRALTYGTNRQNWVDKILYGGAELISGPFAPGSPYYNEEVTVYPYDLERANQLLNEAGFSDRDGDGYRENQNGEAIVLLAIKRQGAKEEDKIWEAFESDMRKLGIKVSSEVLDRDDWKKRVYNKHDFDVAFDTWSFASAGEIYSLFHSSQNHPGEDNYVSYSNSYVDLLLDETRGVLDAKRLQDINKILHEIIGEECPYIFLWSPYKYAGRTQRIRNFKIHPFAFFTYVTEWYIE